MLQCASLALKATVGDLETAKCSRLRALRQEQMMETLECLLQMGSYLHAMVNTTSSYLLLIARLFTAAPTSISTLADLLPLFF